MRLLAAVVARLDALGLLARDAARLAGVRRYCWSSGQVKLAASLPAIARLEQAGIPCLLLKGAAAMAAGDATPADRYVGDVDVLVPPARAEQALDLLFAEGWRAVKGDALARIKARTLPRAHAINLRLDADGALDLHWCFERENGCAGDDDAVWAGARTHELLGRRVATPAPSDRLVQALAQGARWEAGHALDWTIDVLALRARAQARGEDPWTPAVAALRARRLEAHACATLGLLADEVGVPVPDGVREALAAGVDALAARELAALQTPPGRERRAWRPARDDAARRRARGRPRLFAERGGGAIRHPRWARLLGRPCAPLVPAAAHGVGGDGADAEAGLELVVPASWSQARPAARRVGLSLRLVAREPTPLDVWIGPHWVAAWRSSGPGAAWHGVWLPDAAARALRVEGTGVRLTRARPAPDAGAPPVTVTEAWVFGAPLVRARAVRML